MEKAQRVNEIVNQLRKERGEDEEQPEQEQTSDEEPEA